MDLKAAQGQKQSGISGLASEKQHLAAVMERYGIEWEQKGTHEKHLSVLDFQKQERAKEVADLEERKAELLEENSAFEAINGALCDQLAQINENWILRRKNCHSPGRKRIKRKNRQTSTRSESMNLLLK